MTPPPDPLEKSGDGMTNLETLRGRLLALRRQTLSLLAARPEDESLDVGLLAIVANVQNTLVAVEAEMKADGLRVWRMASLRDIGDTSTGKP